MKQNKINAISWIIAIVNIIISLLYILQLPEIVPVHFDLNWVCDNMSSRWIGMFTAILPLLSCIGYPLIWKHAQEGNARYAGILQFAMNLYFIVIHWDVLFTMRSGVQIGDQLDSGVFAWILFGSVGMLYIVMGNYMPVIQPNSLMGFRLKWTLENETCWRMTHRFAGKLLVTFGIFYLLFLLPAMILDLSLLYGIVLLFLIVCIPCVSAAFYAYQHRNDKNF
ncbi:MAG: SdpI family protein [Oscillospiraceae bacterium]|nr:SdpI family protein [Oscillospiraceae bacterium]